MRNGREKHPKADTDNFRASRTREAEAFAGLIGSAWAPMSSSLASWIAVWVINTGRATFIKAAGILNAFAFAFVLRCAETFLV
jgi:hypothetical protein